MWFYFFQKGLIDPYGIRTKNKCHFAEALLLQTYRSNRNNAIILSYKIKTNTGNISAHSNRHPLLNDFHYFDYTILATRGSFSTLPSKLYPL